MRTVTLHLALLLLVVSGESRLPQIVLRQQPWGQQAGPTQDVLFSPYSDIFRPALNSYYPHRGSKVTVSLTDAQDQEEDNANQNIGDEVTTYDDSLFQQFRDSDLQIITTSLLESDAIHSKIWDGSSVLGFDMPLLAYDFELSNHHFQNTTKLPDDADNQIITPTGKPRENDEKIYPFLDPLSFLEPNLLLMTMLCLGLSFHHYFSQDNTETILTTKNPQGATTSRLHLLPAIKVPFLASTHDPFVEGLPRQHPDSDGVVHWDPNYKNQDVHTERTTLPDIQSTKLWPSLLASDLDYYGGGGGGGSGNVGQDDRDACLPACQVLAAKDEQHCVSKEAPQRIIIVDDDCDMTWKKKPINNMGVDLNTLWYDSDSDDNNNDGANDMDDQHLQLDTFLSDNDNDDDNDADYYIPFRALPTLFPYHIPSGFSLDGMDHSSDDDDDDMSEFDTTNLDGFHIDGPG